MFKSSNVSECGMSLAPQEGGERERERETEREREGDCLYGSYYKINFK